MAELGSTLILFRFDLKPAPDFSLVVRNQHKTRASALNSLCK